LSPEEVAELEKPYIPHPVVGMGMLPPFKGRVSILQPN
jgi:hypothetical protein